MDNTTESVIEKSEENLPRNLLLASMGLFALGGAG